jgi:peptidoglycan hydrolase CwlO-like protein
MVGGPVMMYTRHLSNEELERLYYQAGLTEVAAVYAAVDDAEVQAQEYETQIGDMFTDKDYKEVEKERDDLQAKVEAMDAALDAAYRYAEEAKPLNRKKLLALLAVPV